MFGIVVDHDDGCQSTDILKANLVSLTDASYELKYIRIFHLKKIIFTAVKIRNILHRCIIVMKVHVTCSFIPRINDSKSTVNYYHYTNTPIN